MYTETYCKNDDAVHHRSHLYIDCVPRSLALNMFVSAALANRWTVLFVRNKRVAT